MILSKNELLDLFQSVYDTEKSIDVLRKQMLEDLARYAESNNIAIKTIKEAYKVFKAFRDGKITSRDEDYLTILAIIEEEFSREKDEMKEADTVSG